MIDMTKNRSAYGLLTDEEKAVLAAHAKAGGKFVFFSWGSWEPAIPNFHDNAVYRPVATRRGGRIYRPVV